VNIEQSQRREFGRGFQEAFSKLVSNFKEAYKKLKIVKSSEKLLV
jgi:hypothetical protein